MGRRWNKQNLRKWGGIALIAATSLLFLFALLAGYAGFISPIFWAFPSMLALVFLPLFLLSVLVTLGWNLYDFRHPVSIAGDVLFAVLLWPFLTVFPFGSRKTPYPNERTFTVMSFNTFYCNDIEYSNPVRSRTVDYIIERRADIVCLQEIYDLDAATTHGKATTAQVQHLKTLYPYRYEPGGRELVFLSRYPITPISGDEGKLFFQYQIVRINVAGTPVTVINVHLPSFGLSDGERQVVNQMKEGKDGVSESAREMRTSIYGKLSNAFATRANAARIIRSVADTIKGDLIVCGDFNDVPGSYAYRTIQGGDLRDVYRDTYTGYVPTFHNYMMYFHIDQMFYRGDMRALSFERGDVSSSDHYPIVGTFAIPKQKE